MTTAWFHCFSGVAGDMALGSLLDAGADVDAVKEILEQLPVSGWEIEVEDVLRSGIGGTKVHVHAEDSPVVRTAAHIMGLLDEATLPERVRDRSRAVFGALADAEGHLHRRPPDQVHFHEVGGIDAIVDIVGTCAALEVLDVDRVTCSPISLGHGMVRAAHGVIPNPAPAVMELLRGVPTRGLDLTVELTTPTGAALMAGLAEQFGPLPPLTVTASGFGAGTRELDHRPNLTQVVLGEPIVAASAGWEEGQPVVLLETNLDDVTGEVLAHAVSRLMEAGAHDTWITPIVMKKGRPAHTLHVLCDTALVGDLVQLMTAETGTLGVRAQRLERWPATRSTDSVTIDGETVRRKVGPGRVKAEADDAIALARRRGRTLRDVQAEATGHQHHPGPPHHSHDPGGDAPA